MSVLMSEEAFERAVLAEGPERVVCLEVGSTFCRPCKAFDPAYKRVAQDYTPTGVKFLRVDGARAHEPFPQHCAPPARAVWSVRGRGLIWQRPLRIAGNENRSLSRLARDVLVRWQTGTRSP